MLGIIRDSQGREISEPLELATAVSIAIENVQVHCPSECVVGTDPEDWQNTRQPFITVGYYEKEVLGGPIYPQLSVERI